MDKTSSVHPNREMFGRAVRILRLGRRLTQRDLASLSGLRRQHIWEIERGRANPSLITIASVARGLDLRTSELMAEAEREIGAH